MGCNDVTNSATSGGWARVYSPGPLSNAPKDDVWGPCESYTPGTSPTGPCSLDFGTFIVGGAFQHFFPNGDFGGF